MFPFSICMISWFLQAKMLPDPSQALHSAQSLTQCTQSMQMKTSSQWEYFEILGGIIETFYTEI